MFFNRRLMIDITMIKYTRTNMITLNDDLSCFVFEKITVEPFWARLDPFEL